MGYPYNVEELIKELPIIPGKEKLAIKILNKKWEGTIALCWNIEDVKASAEENGIKLSKNEAIEILETIEKYHDCSYGVNWDTVHDCVQEFSAERRRS